MGFIGRNGAGKSTTLKCLMKLINYDQGRIEIFGRDLREFSNEIRQRIGYVHEEQNFYEEMTVAWTTKFIGSFYREWDWTLLSELLRRFEVDPKKRVKDLSKGMKVKLAIALAMAHHPELLILDEPTSGLDPVVRSEILDIFMEVIQNEDCSILFSTHITADVEKIADYITIIEDGRIILSEEKDRLREEWSLIQAENTFFRKELETFLQGVRKGSFGFSGITRDRKSFEREFRKFFPAGTYRTERVDLDELLVRLVKEGEKNVESGG